MEKLKIKQTLKDGLVVLIKNPIIFVPAFFVSLLATISGMMSFLEKYTIIWFLGLPISLFLGAVIIRLVYEVREKQPSWNAIIKFVLSKYVPYSIALVIYFFVVSVPFIGIFLMIKLMFCPYGILLNNKGIINSFKTSWKITKGNWWRLLALDLIFVTPILISAMSSFWLPMNIFAIVYFLVSLFISPWMYSSLTFAYLLLKEKEIEMTIPEGK